MCLCVFVTHANTHNHTNTHTETSARGKRFSSGPLSQMLIPDNSLFLSFLLRVQESERITASRLLTQYGPEETYRRDRTRRRRKREIETAIEWGKERQIERAIERNKGQNEQ